MLFNIEEELKKLPKEPGVYIMRDDKDVILYVGKAVNLHNRVRSYFRENIGRGPAIDKMVSLIARFEYIVTDSELEALVLENNLIKENSPKYNTLLKDDKTYPYIKVTLGEEYPRVQFSRLMKKDKSKYFGPYTSAAAVKDTIELLNKLYRLRTCSRSLPRDIGSERPCLNYHIKQCLGPCQGYVTKEQYREQVDRALEFLNGDYSPILKELEGKMRAAAEELDFEAAAGFRDLYNSVKQVAQKQKITDSAGEDKDVIALYQDDREAVVQVFFVRDGKLIGREHYYMTHVSENSKAEILENFVKQFYAGTPFIPRELIEKWLTGRKGGRVYVRVPKIGAKEKLVELAAQNARHILEQDRERLKREEGRTIGAAKEIAALLGLGLPHGGLRHLQHQRLRERGLYDRLREREAQAQRLPEIPHQDRLRPRRLRLHAGGPDQALPPRAGGEQGAGGEGAGRSLRELHQVPRPADDGRRQGPGEHRPVRAPGAWHRDSGLRHGEGRQPPHQGPVLQQCGAAHRYPLRGLQADHQDSGRGPPLRHRVPQVPAQQGPGEVRPGRDSRRRTRQEEGSDAELRIHRGHQSGFRGGAWQPAGDQPQGRGGHLRILPQTGGGPCLTPASFSVLFL